MEAICLIIGNPRFAGSLKLSKHARARLDYRTETQRCHGEK